MKKILIVAYYYPPLATSGAMRPLAFSRYLLEHGWRVSVLTADPRSADADPVVDEELGARIPSGIDVLRVPHGNPVGTLIRTRDVLRRMTRRSRETVTDTVPARARQSAAAGAPWRDAIVERLFAFPDSRAPWYRPAVRAARAHFERPDVVLATAPPWTGLQVGGKLAREFRVPLVVDFRDPWTANPTRRTLSAWAERQSTREEGRLIEQASLVLANTDESRHVLAARYPAAEHKLLSITNGFDPDFVPRGLRPAGTGGVMELCHFGTVYAQRSPRHLLEALAAVLEAAAGTLSRRLRVRFIGGWEIDDAATNALADRLEAAGLITREPALPHAACLAAMRQAPALLVLQPASPLQIPGKLYEYIASGRPLVVVGGEGATAGLVERERLGVCSPDRTDAIAAMLRRVLDQPESLDAPAADRVAMFDYRILTARLAAALAEITRLPLTTAA